ncbi:MAG: carbonic anhydrase [Pseudomonadota bacterium]|nr:carbonic anhydrase [Pseudomonadota bacterium]
MKTHLVSLAIVSLLSSGASFSADKVHWGYSGHEGPEHWGDLDPEYSTCSSGKNQSPINLTKMIEGDLPELKVDYKVGGNEVVNNGHAIQVNYAAGSMIYVGDHAFELKQLHFHSPSENTIEGHSYPMEAHFVHADKAGNLAVIAVIFKLGKHNLELEKAWKYIPHKTGNKYKLNNMVNANVLLPHDHAYFRFNGSLTTPPCSEGVNWYVMKYFDTASQEQINIFTKAMHHDNNRPVQPVNARMVIQ